MPINTGTGATIAFGTSSFSANVMAINGNDISRPAIDTSHLGTTDNRTFIPGGLVDNGTIELDIQFDPDDQPPIDTGAETITITFPLAVSGQTAAKAVFSGFVTGWSFGVPLEELMTGTVSIKVAGAITWTAETTES